MATAPSRMPLRVIFDRVYGHRLPFDVRFFPKATDAVGAEREGHGVTSQSGPSRARFLRAPALDRARKRKVRPPEDGRAIRSRRSSSCPKDRRAGFPKA